MDLVGYAFLIHRYKIERHLPLAIRTEIGSQKSIREIGRFHFIEQKFPEQYRPSPTLGGHLEFALKYEGTDLSLLIQILRSAAHDEIVSYIRSKETGKYSKRIWYICEEIAGRPLPEIPDATTGNYVDLLEDDEYVTFKSRRSHRHRVNVNLMGTAIAAPMVRKTAKIKSHLEVDYREKAQALLREYEPELIARAVHYLYTKETKSSFEIEHETPTTDKATRFTETLRNVGLTDYLEKKNLIALQNDIVDPRHRDNDFRKNQNYVGESIGIRERVHYICPRPEDVPRLMNELSKIFERGQSNSPFVLAVIIAYLFVFIHPFEDGNGRIHRFLMHDLLHRMKFNPQDIIFPISATLLRNRTAYDGFLESFSEGLVRTLDYNLDEGGHLTVKTPSFDFYRFIDMTFLMEGMFDTLNETIEKDLAEELAYLAKFDIDRAGLKEIVDLPDRKLDLFIKLCLNNDGKLAATKRQSHFADLTDDEIEKLESALLRKSALNSAHKS